MIVCQLHTIIEMLRGPADVKDIDEPTMLARNRLECRHSFKLPEKGAFAFKCAPVNNFDRPQTAGHGPSHPDFSISTPADHAQKFVIRDDRDLSGDLVRNGADFTQYERKRQFRRVADRI